MIRALATAAALGAAVLSAASGCDADDDARAGPAHRPETETEAKAETEAEAEAEAETEVEVEVDPAETVVDDAGVQVTTYEVEPTPTPELLPVPEVARLVREDEAVLCDVNAREAREYFGVVPGAIELSHPSRFDLDELPADREGPLIFYCATPSCGASLQSGTRAILAGYEEVYALRGGIVAWRDAGRETVPPGAARGKAR